MLVIDFNSLLKEIEWLGVGEREMTETDKNIGIADHSL